MTRLIILLLAFVAFNLDGQCIFGELVLEQSSCNNDDNFTVAINFEYDEVGSMGFLVQGNGQSYGTFNYADLPISIEDLPGNCTTDWEFSIKDVEFPDCSIGDNIGEVCCGGNCSLEILDFTNTDCVNGGFNITFDVAEKEDSNLGADVYLNGTFYEFVPYEDFPVTFVDVPSLNDIENTLVVCDNDNLMCCDTLTFESPCACTIKNVRGRHGECAIGDSLYWIYFDFDTNMVSDSFVIGGNGVYLGVHAYTDLPLHLGPVPFHADTAYYLIADQRNSFCFNELSINPIVDCDVECRFDSITVETTACENGEFYALLTIDTNNPGLNGFSVSGNGVVYEESLPYGLGVYEIGPLEGDCETLYEFILKDVDNPEFCNGEIGLSEVLCCPICEIKEFNVNVECNDGKVDKVIINFLHLNSLDSMFFVEINEGTFGPFSSNDLPITIDVDLPGTEEVRVVVYDAADESCRKVKELIPECGLEPCPEYFDIVTEFSECKEDSTFSVFVSFGIEGMHSDSFFISVGDQIFGPYSHGEASYEVGPLVSDCERTILKFIDGDRPDCVQFYEIDEIKCCDESCEIGEVIIEVECDGEKMVGFDIKVVKGGNLGSKYHLTIGNKEFGTFDYDETHYIEECLTNGVYTMVIMDIEFPDCRKELGLEVNCEIVCEIGEVNIEVECVDGKMKGFTIVVEQGGSISSKYQILLEGIEYVPFVYGAEKFVEVSLENGTYTMTIIDTEDPDCTKEVSFEVDCGDTPECDFENLTATAINCTDETFMFQVNVDHGFDGSDLFQLFVNGELVGTSSYSFLPVVTGELNRDSGEAWKILIKDVDNPDCTIDIVIEDELCESNTNELDFELSVTNVSNGLFLQAKNNQYTNVKLYDVMGVQLYNDDWKPNSTHMINTSSLQRGIGILVLESNGKRRVIKVIM